MCKNKRENTSRGNKEFENSDLYFTVPKFSILEFFVSQVCIK